MSAADSGLYVLMLGLERAEVVRVGQWGTRPFGPGWHLYVGSAKRNLRARLARHAGDTKRLRWHVDYLRQHASLREVWVFPWSEGGECELARRLAQVGQRTALRFGSSDCGCEGHLVWIPRGGKRRCTRALRATGGWRRSPDDLI